MFAEFVVFRQQALDRVRRDTSLAWHIAAFSRQKKLRPLEYWLDKRGEKPKAQTPQEMKNVLHKLGMKPKPMSDQTKKSLKYIRVQ